jgi:hypothetical protein
MKDPGLYIIQLIYTESICCLQYALRPVILVVRIAILEINGVFTWQELNFDALGLEIKHKPGFSLCERSDQEVFYIHIMNGIGEVKGGTSGHIHSGLWGYNFIECYMPYATDIVH